MAGKGTRLSKIAREFNVGISTIVEFLNKKGYEVDPNPNTKVTEEIYDILIHEYSADISVKKESDLLSLKNLRDKKETISINDIDKQKPIAYGRRHRLLEHQKIEGCSRDQDESGGNRQDRFFLFRLLLFKRVQIELRLHKECLHIIPNYHRRVIRLEALGQQLML